MKPICLQSVIEQYYIHRVRTLSLCLAAVHAAAAPTHTLLFNAALFSVKVKVGAELVS